MDAPEFGGCATCEGRCCREYLVPLTCLDVHRLARALALPPERFALLVPDDEPSSIRLTAGGPGFAIVLDKREPQRDRASCVFLMELADGTGRCGVYADRPRACRTFPTTLERGALALMPGIVCGPGSWDLSRMDVAAWRDAHSAAETEQKLHQAVVAAWNASLGPADAHAPSDFFRFALERCERIVRALSTSDTTQ